MSCGIEHICDKVRMIRIDVMRFCFGRLHSAREDGGVFWLENWNYAKTTALGLAELEVKVMGRRLSGSNSILYSSSI